MKLSNRIWRFGADVDTDQIVPGRYAPYVTSEAELGRYPFIEARPEFAEEVRAGDVIVAGPNFGCGSSREYAPQALRLAGVGAILAPGFARIFYRNALNLGLPTYDLAPDGLQDGAPCLLDVDGDRLWTERGPIPLPAPSPFAREVWAAGGVVPYFREHGRFPGEVLP